MQTEELKKLSKELKANLSQLIEKRSTWENHWQEVADYFLTRKADVNTQRTRGDKRNIQIFDSSAIHSLELLASSLHGSLTSGATRWFSLRFKEAAINEDDSSREWIEDATEKMYLAFARSNFQQEIFESYFDLVTFGTSCVMIEEDDEDVIRFSSRQIKEIYISEDARGMVNCIYRRFKISAKAAVEKFGFDNLSRSIQNTYKSTPFDDVELCHVVKPREMYNPKKLDKSNMPFFSAYFEYNGDHIISQSGFREFPYVVPRYLKGSNEIYGRSPAMSALPDVKILNKMIEIGLKAAAKQVDPPLLVPDDSFTLPVRMSPGSINFYRAGSRDRIEPLNIGANNPLGLNLEEQRRKSIARIFHVDQLLASETARTLTATEVMQRNDEKMRIIGPVMSRLQSELLQPLIIRVFSIMLRNKLFSPAPEILNGQEIEVEYVSPLAIAQKSTELSSIMRGLEIFGSISQVTPIQDWLNEKGLVKQIIKTLGLPAKMINSDAEVEEIKATRQQQQAQQAEMQQAMQEAKVAKDAAPMVQTLNETTNKQ
jgi:hypothetical protein